MHTTAMTDTRDKSHDPSARALARWETEGGAPKEGRNSKRRREPNQFAELIVDMAMGEALREAKLEDGKIRRQSRWANSAAEGRQPAPVRPSRPATAKAAGLSLAELRCISWQRSRSERTQALALSTMHTHAMMGRDCEDGDMANEKCARDGQTAIWQTR